MQRIRVGLTRLPGKLMGWRTGSCSGVRLIGASSSHLGRVIFKCCVLTFRTVNLQYQLWFVQSCCQYYHLLQLKATPYWSMLQSPPSSFVFRRSLIFNIPLTCCLECYKTDDFSHVLEKWHMNELKSEHRSFLNYTTHDWSCTGPVVEELFPAGTVSSKWMNKCRGG